MVLPNSLGAGSRSRDRKSMLDRAILLVEKARRSGAMLEIDAEAENLLNAYPKCGMSFAELRADLATVVSRGRSGDSGVPN